MAAPRDLDTLRDEALELADLELSTFVTEANVNRRINRSIEALWEKIADGSPFSVQAVDDTLVTVAGTSTVALPSDFYQLIGVDVKTGSEWEPAAPLDFARRNDFDRQAWSRYQRVRYLEEGTALRLFPTPDSVYSVRVWYVPTAPELSTGTDLLNIPQGWDEWVVADVAQWYKTKAEEDISELLAKKMEVDGRILRAARKRSRTGHIRVRNVRGGRRTRGWDEDWGRG